MNLPASVHPARKAALQKIEKYTDLDELEEVRQEFIRDLKLSPDLVARKLGCPESLAMEVIVSLDWMKDRKSFHKVSTETELLRYQELIKQHRLPAVERQLGLLERLNSSIEFLFERSEIAQDRIRDAVADGASSDELAVLYARLFSPKQLLELAGACEKANTIAGRLLNIRENLFQEVDPETAGTRNLFILPGAMPTRSLEKSLIDVTPV